MSDTAGGDRQEIIEELEERRDAHAEKESKYKDEKAAWFGGLKTGYQSAIEVIRGEEDE